MTTTPLTIEEIREGFLAIQNKITAYLVDATEQAPIEDKWDYHKGAGGGITRVWEGDNDEQFYEQRKEGVRYDVLEKGGVNFSCIEGSSMPGAAATAFSIDPTTSFVATGVSLVLHAYNPNVPTCHMNVRFFQAGSKWWFGGGIDVTPVYVRASQVVRYHAALKQVCDEFGSAQHNITYARGKDTCDTYFYLKHRDETRGVGGLFFDHLTAAEGQDAEEAKRSIWRFIQALGLAFVDLYSPFLADNRQLEYTKAQRDFQLFRRSRYVEFNLLFDRGTKFGIQSEGRIESIFMSLPAVAKWRYNFKPTEGTREYTLTDFFLKPQDWLSLSNDQIQSIDQQDSANRSTNSNPLN
eukprot:gene3738-4311_t